jgi:hypothetical protein
MGSLWVYQTLPRWLPLNARFSPQDAQERRSSRWPAHPQACKCLCSSNDLGRARTAHLVAYNQACVRPHPPCFTQVLSNVPTWSGGFKRAGCCVAFVSLGRHSFTRLQVAFEGARWQQHKGQRGHEQECRRLEMSGGLQFVRVSPSSSRIKGTKNLRCNKCIAQDT